jgi:D-alanyl-D-alanine carboxypeptidase
MTKIIGSIISFFLSLFSIFNVVTLPQDEQLNNEDDIFNSNVLTIEQYVINNDKAEELNIEKPLTSSSSNWWEYPDDIKQTTRNGDDLLVLVNKEYKLPSTYAPNDLVKVGDDVIRRGNSYYLRSIVIDDLKNLVNDAKKDNIDLSIVSAYRSYDTQATTYQYWVNYNNGCISCADRISARAGHSQHQLGTTLDFSTSEIDDKLGSQFDNTDASNWLKENAYKYGFVIGYPKGYETVTGYSYESWHYRYIGKENALEMRNSGQILETYLKSKN